MANCLELTRSESVYGMPCTLNLCDTTVRNQNPISPLLDCTFRVGSAVSKINTAHSINVLGGFSVGITGSGGASAAFSLRDDKDRCERSIGGGGGSANSACLGG